MTTAVLLAFSDGSKEFVREAHVHGYRDGLLLIAAGAPGRGFDAEVVRSVSVAELTLAETCQQDDDEANGASGGPDWSMSWPDA